MTFEVIEATGQLLPSPARVHPAERGVARVALVQVAYSENAEQHQANLREGIALGAQAGAKLVCLQELTLSPYFAISDKGPVELNISPEQLPGGPTHLFVKSCAEQFGVAVHASLYEQASEVKPLGYNTAICVNPAGELIARTRKTHIPVTAGYYEDKYFVGGKSGTPVVDVDTMHVGFPTCWDQWFPELARAYSLSDADVLVYPTAIGSEPDHPQFDTQPLWQSVIVGNAIANGLNMIVPNRIGTEGPVTFYGSSFICDVYGRILAQAPRDKAAVLVADIDLDARRDWLELFPFLSTRRPDAYRALTEQVSDNE